MAHFQSLKEILEQKAKTKNKRYISRGFQDYGYRLAESLNDLRRKSLYIKLAKETPKAVLEKAKSYVIDYPKVKNKGALFMWKLKELQGNSNLKPSRRKKIKGPRKLPLF